MSSFGLLLLLLGWYASTSLGDRHLKRNPEDPEEEEEEFLGSLGERGGLLTPEKYLEVETRLPTLSRRNQGGLFAETTTHQLVEDFGNHKNLEGDGSPEGGEEDEDGVSAAGMSNIGDLSNSPGMNDQGTSELLEKSRRLNFTLRESYARVLVGPDALPDTDGEEVNLLGKGAPSLDNQVTVVPVRPSSGRWSGRTPTWDPFRGEIPTGNETLGRGGPSPQSNENHHTHLEVCHEHVETGLCRAAIPRWYFNASDGICREFIYGGCRGNKNNFNKEYKCYATCKGEVPCTKDHRKVCLMSESPCMDATCPGEPEAECAVLPCTCEAVFEDATGASVDCQAVTVTSTPEGNVTTVPPFNKHNQIIAVCVLVGGAFALLLFVVVIGYWRWRTGPRTIPTRENIISSGTLINPQNAHLLEGASGPLLNPQDAHLLRGASDTPVDEGPKSYGAVEV